MNSTTSPSLGRMAVFTAMLPDWSPRRVCEQLRLAGLNQVEWATHYPVGSLPVTKPWHLDLSSDGGNAPLLRDLGDEFGLKVVCLSGTPDVRDKVLPRRLFEAAALLDCSMIRLGVAQFHEEYAGREGCRRAAEALGKWLPEARDRNIKLLIEIHADNITCSPELTRRIVEGFDPEDVGIVFDPGNMVVQGMTPWKLAIELLGAYLAHVHVKNLGWFRDKAGRWSFDYTPLDSGIVDWHQVIQMVEAFGYRGSYSFEDFRGGYCCAPVGLTSERKLCEDVGFLEGILQPQTSILAGSSV